MDGRQDYLHALPEGYRLQDYEISRVLGHGSFGITYLGYDRRLDCAVAIKEYLPSDWAVRHEGVTVRPRSPEDKERFEWGLDQFIQEARTLEKFRYETVIRIRHCIVENSTAYLVMDYAEGETLSAFLKRKGPLDEATLKSMLLPILDGLEKVHETGFLHRDIKPSNIIIRTDGIPVLIDFGAARQAIGDKSRALTAILTPGYAPIEQYGDDAGEQGPWTDIYALGAVAHEALTGKRPKEAAQRVRSRTHVPLTEAAEGRAAPHVLAAIDAALAVDETDRPQSIGEWRRMLLAEEPATTLQPSSTVDEATRISEPVAGAGKTQSEPATGGRSPASYGKYGAVAAVALIALGALFAARQAGLISTPETPVEATATAPSSSASPAAPPVDPAVNPRPEVFTVAKDGSADFETISKAIAEAPEGGTVRIKSGTYRETLVLNRTLHLEGVGNRADIVIVSDQSDVLKIEGGSGSVKNLTFKYDGQNEDHATAWITGGAYLIEDCGFSSEASVGIYVEGGEPTLKDSFIHDTRYSALNIRETAAGTYTGNQIFNAGFKSPDPNSDIPEYPAVFLSPQSEARFLDDNRIDGEGYPIVYPGLKGQSRAVAP